jgi:hypothetical protein
MNLVERFEDQVYSLCLCLINDPVKSKAISLKVFIDCLGKTYGSYDIIRLRLFRHLLKNLDEVSVKRDKNDSFLIKFKRGLPIFDRKVFVLKYEFELSTTNTAFVMGVKKNKVRKSLLFSTERLAKKLASKKSPDVKREEAPQADLDSEKISMDNGG